MGHPRWKLIPTFEFITIIDLAKLVHLIQDKYYPHLVEYTPESKEKELIKVHEFKSLTQTWT